MTDFDKTQEFPIDAFHDEKKTVIKKTLQPSKREPAETFFQLEPDLFHEMILVFTIDGGKIQTANQRAMEMTGYVDKELKNMKIGDLLPPDRLDQLWSNLPEDSTTLLLREMEIINRELELIPVEANARIIREDEGGSVLFVARDATWRKASLQASMRNEKFVSVERAAGIFTTFFSQKIYEIMNDIEFTHNAVDPQSTFYRRLAGAMNQCNDMMELLEKLTRLAGAGSFTPSVSSIGSLVEKAVASMEAAIAPELFISDELWPVMVDTKLLQKGLRVFLQYMAADLSLKNRMQLKVENCVHPNISGHPQTGEFIEISIHVSGKAISGDQFMMLFDPDISLNKPDHLSLESGLDIAMFYAVVKRHQGHIHLHPVYGSKTHVSIYLPSVQHSPISEKQPDSSTAWGGNGLGDGMMDKLPLDVKKGRVLLMDDEEIVRLVAGDMLGILGYQVTFAENGEEAVSCYHQAMKQQKPFDAVILDLNIAKGMGGRAVIRELLVLNPEVRGIVSSGYSTAPGMTDYKRYGFKAMISKPYTLKDLKSVLENIMD